MIYLSVPLGNFLNSHLNLKWTELIPELGKAFIIASVLSLTVDFVLKKRLESELKEDVFKAAMGYLFPEEIRDEVKWFYNFPLLASRRDHYITIEKINDQYVDVISADKPADIEVQIWGDEWGVKDRPTQLVELGYEHKNKRVQSAIKPPTERRHNNQSIQWTYGKVKLAPKGHHGDEIRVWRKLKETKGINDNIWWVSLWPTVNPQVRICAPEFEVNVGYMGREERAALEKYENGAYRLPGTILPSQVLIVKWWPKKEAQ